MKIDSVAMTPNQALALTAWRDLPEDYDVLSFRRIHELSGLPLPLVRRTVRAMARKGLVQFYKGCWTEDGDFAGSGYGLAPAGRAAILPLVTGDAA